VILERRKSGWLRGRGLIWFSRGHAYLRRIPHELDQAGSIGELRVDEKRAQITMQAGRLEIPVDQQNIAAVAGEDPGDVRNRHRAAGAALVRVERNDASGFSRHHTAFPSSRRLAIRGRTGGPALFGGFRRTGSFLTIRARISSATELTAVRNCVAVPVEMR